MASERKPTLETRKVAVQARIPEDPQERRDAWAKGLVSAKVRWV